MTYPDIPRIPTGVRNLDAIFNGGLPKGSVIVVSGSPGSGKTILTQQICFHNAAPDSRVLYFGTLSEPMAKTLRYLRQLSFFDAAKMKAGLEFVDLGEIARGSGLEQARTLMLGHIKRVKPTIVVIDSFKVFDDLARSPEDLRKFGYEIAVNLMAWESTALLLGEYGPDDYKGNPLFSIVDGLVILSQQEVSGEHQRTFQIVKMRGTDHSHDAHSFVITADGLEMFAPRVEIQREEEGAATPVLRSKTGIDKLDEILGDGIPLGSSLLLSGVAGTGKTVLSLEFIYRGALAGERGVLFSFEETEQRLRAAARGLGYDIDREIERGMIEIVFIPQPEIMVEAHILMMREHIEKMQAKRVVIDSLSVFLHKVEDPQLTRERVFHLCSIVQNAQAVAFFTTDVPYGSGKISRFGVEETVVDGVIILSATEEGLDRQRYLEVYKLRNTAHLKGRHNLLIRKGGAEVYPRYHLEDEEQAAPALEIGQRIATGVPGLDTLLGGGLLRRSVTVVSGSAGSGKTTLAMQFLLAGVAVDPPEQGLFVSLEESPAQLLASADAIGLPLRRAVEAKQIEIMYAFGEHLRAWELLSRLSERVASVGARRVVVDAATYFVSEGGSFDELRKVLSRLSVRFKNLAVTSLLTVEAASLTDQERVTERALSPIADNLLMLRYHEDGARLSPSLTVVKTRGSAHNNTRHDVELGHGGMRIHDPSEPSETPTGPKHMGRRAGS